MNGKSMKMELDGNINIKDSVEEISKKIKRNKTRIFKFYAIFTINHYKNSE